MDCNWWSSLGPWNRCLPLRNAWRQVTSLWLFQRQVQGSQTTWLPCEVEALSIAAATKHYSPYLIQSIKKACILTDRKPCVQAYEKLPWGVLCQPLHIHFLVCWESLPSFSQARFRRCYPPVRLRKPKRRLWKRDLSGVLFHFSNQGLCCPSRFCSRCPPRQCSPSLYQPAHLRGCSVWVPRSTQHPCSPRPGYETFQKTHKHKGHQTLFTSCVSCRWWPPCCAASWTLVTIERVHHCPMASFGRPFDRSSHSTQPPVLSPVENGCQTLSICSRSGQGRLSCLRWVPILCSNPKFSNHTYWPVHFPTTQRYWSVLRCRRHQTFSPAYLCPPRDCDPLHFQCTDPAPGFKALIDDPLLKKHRITI